jgi:hypothetical protein
MFCLFLARQGSLILAFQHFSDPAKFKRICDPNSVVVLMICQRGHLLSPKSAVKNYDIEEAEKKDSGSECLG